MDGAVNAGDCEPTFGLLPRLHLFQCGDSRYFALSLRKYAVRLLPQDIAAGAWHYCQPIDVHDLGSYYVEASKLVERHGYCILNLEANACRLYAPDAVDATD